MNYTPREQRKSSFINETDFDLLLENVCDEIDIYYQDNKTTQDISPHLNINKISELYEYEKQIGNGASCRVLLAKNKYNNLKYAVKEMKQTSPNNDLFNKESSILKYLNHSNIVDFYQSYISQNDYYYIATSYCSGGTMLQRVKLYIYYISMCIYIHCIHYSLF